MSITAKQHFLNTVGNELTSILTVRDYEVVQERLNNVLSKFQLEELESGEIDSNANDYLMAFLDAKKIECRSEKTIKHYNYILSKMLNELNVSITSITVFHLRNYLMKKKNNGIADKTLEGIRSVMCSFFGWLQKEGLLKENPCANLSPIKCAKKERLPYSDIEIEKLKEVCWTNRDRAIISFLLSTGCRISEVCGLNKDNINFQTNECIVFGKGNKERIVFTDDVTSMLLKRYIEERTDDSDALFVGKGSNRMTTQGIRARLCTLAKIAGVTNVHPHRFRRTLATNLIKHGMPIQNVAILLGHDKLDTTMKYVYVDKTDIKHSYKKYA